ncbi:hypothetical protein Scel_20950 [Streptomyces cellostaticus]|nr:hypothetical protein Scel_20950 [Streptomyces cellostaticus]
MEWRTVPVPSLRSVRSSLPWHTGHSSRWYIAVPHQVQRWKRMASLESAEAGSRTPAAEPAAECEVLAEWWYTLVNSLRSAGIPRARREPRTRVRGDRATVHADRVWHSVSLVKALRTPNLRRSGAAECGLELLYDPP